MTKQLSSLWSLFVTKAVGVSSFSSRSESRDGCGSKCGWGTSFSSRSESREQAVGVGRNVDGEQALVVDQKVESKL